MSERHEIWVAVKAKLPLVLCVIAALAFIAALSLQIAGMWRSTTVDEPSVAEAFSGTLQQLGIRPVYPPTEDLHVGDIWVTIVQPTANAQAPRPASILSRGVRIGHADLRREMVAAGRRRPLFAAGTPENASSSIQRLEVSERPEGDRISLASIGFPAITTRRSVQANASGGFSIFALSGGGQETYLEELSIPQAVGYGVDAATAALALVLWCREQAGLCYRARLLQVLRFAFGEQEVSDDAVIEVSLVNYAYATREIQMNRQRESGRSLAGDIALGTAEVSARASEPPPLPPAALVIPGTMVNPVHGGAAPPNGAKAEITGTSSIGATGAGASGGGSENRIIKTSTKFDRLAVFGFRAVAIEPQAAR